MTLWKLFHCIWFLKKSVCMFWMLYIIVFEEIWLLSGSELVNCSIACIEPAFYLLNVRLSTRSRVLAYTFHEAEECDFSKTGGHPLLTFSPTGTIILSCQSTETAPDLQTTLEKWVPPQPYPCYQHFRPNLMQPMKLSDRYSRNVQSYPKGRCVCRFSF